MKTCTKCGVEKDDAEFYKKGTSLRSHCISCGKTALIIWRKNNKEKDAE